MTSEVRPGDDAVLDAILDAAVAALAAGRTFDLTAMLGGREHLRPAAERLIAVAHDVGIVRAPVAAARTPWSPPGFTILEEVGRGGMGIVYRARQDSLGRIVALKVLSPALLVSSRSRERFAVEARALARLRHPHVVAVHEIVVQDAFCAYAMEWIGGPTLAYVISQPATRPVPRVVAQLGTTIARALAAVHAAGLVHRDVKPGNILLREDGSPALSDFGLVRDDHASMHTATGEFIGTIAFAAPEQLRGEHDRIGPWTDVYGLGVTIYAALTGDTPFSASSRAALLRRIEEGDPVPLRRRLAALPRDLETIVAKAIDRDPSRRYPTATAFADDLERFLAHRPITARRAGFAVRVQRWLERSPQLALALGALFVTLLVGLPIAIYLALDLAAQRTVARQAEDRALARQHEFDQLAGVVLHARAVAAEESLYPPWPQRIAAMATWLREDAGRLLRMRAPVAQTLADLRTRASGSDDDLRFADASEQFLYGTLHQLAADLDRFATQRVPAVEQRLGWAERIAALGQAHPRARVGWDEARAAIRRADGRVAHELYRDQPIELRDEDVIGLVPIGMNPATRLWEFYDLRSAWDGTGDPAALPIPVHAPRGDDPGHIAVGDDTGIVFVLLPGGTFWLGAQADDPAAPNYDPQCHKNEAVHRVTIGPFFLARHELTQGQWRRLSGGETPSHYPAGTRDALGKEVTWAHPVEFVDWTMAATLLQRHGMALPTEAQWEYGARAGTSTPWWTGADRESLRGAANLVDRSAADAGANWSEIAEWPEFDDGFMIHAPVDTLRPNAFGLHHVHANVWEWCADVWGPYSLPTRAGDGLRLVPAEAGQLRVPRGGSFTSSARAARVAHRREYTPTLRYISLGVRAARPLRQE